MQKQIYQAEYSDDDEDRSVVKPQNCTAYVKANACRKEDRESRPVITVTDISKAFRLVEPGLMLEGTCTTHNCIAYQQRALHIFGYVNQKNFASAKNKAVCRLCKNKLQDVNNIGYFQTILKINGKLQGQKAEINLEYIANDGHYHTFKNGEDKQVLWEFLDLTTEKLKQ